MSELLNIYRTQFKTTLAETAQYRANLAIWILSLVTEPIVYMAVWTNIAQAQGGSVSGFSAGEFAAYYIVWMLVRHFTVTMSPDVLEWRVRTGEFSMMILRPVHPVHVDIAGVSAYKLTALPIVLAMMAGLAIVFQPTFKLQLWAVLAFIPALLLAFLIRFLSHWILGLIAFWTTRAKALFETFFVMEIFLTGRFVPLALLPPAIEILATVLPFRWMVSFPVELFLGRIKPQDALIGFGAQIIWLALMIGLLQVVWRAALRRYAAVGA
jgi:ABC-2 type transport system permease protein